jgi:putative transposase
MPRANRYFIPGNIWHITHRCHNRDFLLKFKRERLSWIYWLYKSRKRFRIAVLNYIVTSNHIHLLVKDNSDERNIPHFMQLLQGRTAQEYNYRKGRKGAFWEDRYHATAIESDEHLTQCMGYISLNMVRAGAVNDPLEWKESGYYEIEFPKKRYTIIDYPALLKLLNFESMDQLQRNLRELVKDMLVSNNTRRESKWTEAIAVGSQPFCEKIKQQLDVKAKTRKIINIKSEESFVLSESDIPYNVLLDTKIHGTR